MTEIFSNFAIELIYFMHESSRISFIYRSNSIDVEENNSLNY